MFKQMRYYILIPALVLVGCGLYLLARGEASAGQIRNQVVRFHVVGQSDSPEDQALKLKVRDGIFQQIRTLFADCADGEEALRVATNHRQELARRAEEILAQNGCDAPVSVEVGQCFFPTKDYGALIFPAGRYQAVSVRIGAAEGQNFWCVLYPALCLAPAVATEQCQQELAAVVGEEQAAFLQPEKPVQKIRFALVEWFEYFKEKICKS